MTDKLRELTREMGPHEVLNLKTTLEYFFNEMEMCGKLTKPGSDNCRELVFNQFMDELDRITEKKEKQFW